MIVSLKIYFPQDFFYASQILLLRNYSHFVKFQIRLINFSSNKEVNYVTVSLPPSRYLRIILRILNVLQMRYCMLKKYLRNRKITSRTFCIKNIAYGSNLGKDSKNCVPCICMPSHQFSTNQSVHVYFQLIRSLLG